MVKNPLANAGDTRDVGSIPGLRRPHPPEGKMATHSTIPSLENPMGRGAWRATVCGATKSRTQLSE